jgi:hypothetical protein
MRSRKEQKGRNLTDHELKGARGGTNSPPSPFLGDDQNPDARAVVIEDGAS